MSNALIEHNRRAVYSALSTVCNERSLLEQAFFFWEERYSQQSTFRVSQYIDALMQEVGLNQAQRRELSVALYAAMGKADQALAAVPAVLRRGSALPATSATTPAVTRPTTSRCASTTVLSELLSQLVAGAARARKSEDLIELLDLTAHELTATSLRAAKQWIAGELRDTATLAMQVEAQDRRAVVNLTYIALCEAIGPTTADRILGQAVQHTERIPEAFDFSPRQLL